MLRTIYLSLFIALISLPAIGQKKENKTKFGKISDAEMAMSEYKDDPAAPAVILFDKGRVSHSYHENVGFSIVFERHARTKVFKKEALLYSDIILFHHKDNKIEDVRATSYNLENGKLTETKLTKENIYVEEITRNYRLTKFIIPGVREGSVVEYQYTMRSPGGIGMPNEWEFQHEVMPTVWSEFEASVPLFIEYKKMSSGWVPFSYTKEDQAVESIRLNLVNRSGSRVNATSFQNVKLDYIANKMHFIQENVPALKPEGHVNSAADYLSKITFDVQRVYDTDIVPKGQDWEIVNTLPTEFNRSWKRLGEELLDDVYAKEIKTSKNTKDIAQSCTTGKTAASEKLAAIYEHIGTNYQVQQGFERIFLSQKLDALVQAKKGTPTDLNILLINMLGQAGVRAHPMLISTTDNGRVLPFLVSFRVFNRVIAAVEMEDGYLVLVDASAFPHPIGLLGKDALNGEGLLLKSNGETDWLPIQNKLLPKTATIADMALDAEGNLQGSVVHYESCYGAISCRKAIKAQGEEKMLRDQFKAWLTEGQVFDIALKNATEWNESNLKTDFKFQTPGFATVSGDKMYLSPLAGLGMHENPFKNPDRKFNVDFGPVNESSYNLSFKLPEGYKVESLPESIKIYFEENQLSFDYFAENKGDMVKINVRYKQKTDMVDVSAYPMLQEFFTALVSKMEEQIVFSKM